MPRRDDVGLEEAVVPRRTARAVVRHHVVAAFRGSLRVDGADRDDGACVARRGHARVPNFTSRGIDADVAGRRHDDDARARCGFNGLYQRVTGGGLEDRMAERQIDDVDAEGSLVGDGEVDGVDHIARVALAVGVEDAQGDDPGARRDTFVLPVGGRAAAAEQARDVRPMAVVVSGRDQISRSAVEEVVEVETAGEVVDRLDAGIDHRYADARSGERRRRQSERVAKRGDRRTRTGAARNGVAEDLRVGMDAGDGRVARIHRDVAAGDIRGQRAEPRVFAKHGIAARVQRLLDGRARAGQRRDDDALRGRRR